MVTKVSESPMTNNDIFQTDDYKEPENIESNNFTPNVRIGESNNFTDKEQNLNNSDSAINESHGRKIGCELFCVTGKDSDTLI